MQEAVNFKVASSNLAGAVDNITTLCYDCLVQTIFIMDLNVNNLVRSGVILVLGLPVTIGLTVSVLSSNSRQELASNVSVKEEVVNELTGKLTRPCLNYFMSKDGSKLERTSQNQIDEVMDGEVVHSSVCKWVLE